jgi:chemotaxis family two-component system sensor kinase Cph1
VRGLAPEASQLNALVRWLDLTLESGRVFATDCISEAWPDGPPLTGDICGVLALAVSREPKDFVIWFLPELRSDVRWAGEPTKVREPTPLGERLTPRKSFELWTESVRGRSRAWTEVEVEGAGMLSIAILEIMLRRLDLLVREREHARGQQDLLLAELDHRVKNTLATIQSMVRFSSRSAPDLPGFVEAIELRLQSMAKTHNALTQRRWEGAPLRGIVDDELRAHLHSGEKVTVSGPDYVLEPKAAMAISMVLHELTTNAVKYGGLSAPGGALEVVWRETSRGGSLWLTLDWIETCVQPIAEPTRRGFGRTLLERVFAQDVDGRVTSAFAPRGMSYCLEVPMSRVSLSDTPVSDPQGPASGKMAPRAEIALDGLKILLVEDAPLVAEDLAMQLRALGGVVTGPFFRLADAMAAAPHAHDVALLDVDLDRERVWDLADALRNAGTPFVLTTGFSGSATWPARFVDQVPVTKPYDLKVLRGAISRAVRPD